MTGTRQDSAPTVSAPTHYFLKFPESWWNLDLDPSTRDASIRRGIQANLAMSGGAKAGPEQVDSLVRAARKSARSAHARGALQMAGVFDLFEDGSTLIGTSMVLRVVPPPEEPPELVDLMLAYAVRNAKLPLGKNTPGNQTDMIDLPYAGPAGRVTSVEDIDFYGKGWVRMAMLQTVVPIPGTADFLVIAGSTPNLTLMEPFFEVFDAIAETLRFEPEEPEGVA
ncbi:hypothetical protein [Streptomyces sp. NPDC020681]|uniref:hypothetical protein n=1 Tax=Streptomyces sp. NPDC020681 TaxID=3365083 RepID=UPI0037A417B2